MIEKLIIQNIGLVDTIEIEFTKGLTVFTGETGAGKSMLLSALLLLLGEKVSASIIRSGTSQAQASAQWDISHNDTALHWLQSHCIECSDGIVITRRVIKRSGNPQCFIQNLPVTMTDFGDFAQCLCEVHAQHEHQQLFKSSEQRNILDVYANVTKYKADFARDLKEYKNKKKEWEEYKNNEEEHKKEIKELMYAVSEIEEASLKDNEDDILTKELQYASQKEILIDLWKKINSYINDDADESRQGVLSALKKTLDLMNEVKKQSESDAITKIIQRVYSVILEIEDVVFESKKFEEELRDIDPQSIVLLEKRLSHIEILKKKYGKTLEDVTSFFNAAKKKINDAEMFDVNTDAILSDLKKQSKSLIERSEYLHTIRVEKAMQFSQKVNTILHNLAMQSAIFKIDVPEIEKNKRTLNSYGYDSIRYMIRSNTGEKYFPIGSIASGGELSRIMLAIRIASSAINTGRTLVLDEIDAGIGGKTAVLVASYLNMLAENMQVICVSHLPIIASCAQSHYYVYKEERDGRTHVAIRFLNDTLREDEIARMMVGNEKDPLAKIQAKKMMNSFKSRRYKHE